MTPDERANKIFTCLDRACRCDSHPDDCELVASEIREAVDTAQLRQMDVDAAYWKSKISEAYEDAAKIADALVAECDAHSGVGNLQSTKFREAASSHWVSMSNGAEEVASRIRARKDEVCK